ncbi:TATA-box-binding protein-like isoform X3 [Coffea eugenioides]|uniref:TATA-box-binding protein-like isoform X2 n=1 Tax=Coffea arabica TaxID=13443 RepID=A0ABM4V7M8_COFAR|nr:TATA-box-binding protein-like isoform X3 [Coffea eugenioides]
MPSLLQSHIRQWKRINSPYVSSENTAGVYEELFPGLINWMEQPKIVLLIFVSAKIVLTGAKVSDETYTTFENIYPVLTEFRKNQQCSFSTSKVGVQ